MQVTEVTIPSLLADGIAPAPLPSPTLGAAAAALLLWAGGVITFGFWLVRRGFFVGALMRRAETAPTPLQVILGNCLSSLSVRQRVQLRLSLEISVPAVCGLWRPIILLPASMADGLSPAQLRSVLLHELAHVRRRDLWVNHAQSVFQILYWWHPIVWFANAAIRRVREQAVDEQVMLALGADADDYPATLVEMAKRVSRRPFPALGLVGILEHRSALKTRIRRLLERPLPATATLSLGHLFLILLVGLVALPMNATRVSRREPTAVPISEAYDATPPATKPVSAPLPGPVSTSTIIITTHASLVNKLERLRLAEFSAANEPLSNVLVRLSAAARLADPERQGVNFLLTWNADDDPLNLIAGDDLGNCRITFQPAIANISFRQVLDAIVTLAPCPLKYSVQDYAVILYKRNRETDSPPLHTRWYKVDPKTLAASLDELIGGRSSGNNAARIPVDPVTHIPDPEALLAGIIQLFKKAGVEFRPPKSVTFGDLRGLLRVRATTADLEVIEQVIQVANATPQQVVVQARFVQVFEGGAASAKLSALLGFDIAAKKGTTLSTGQPPNARAKAGPAPTNLPPPVFTGILSADQYRAAIAALVPAEGAEIIATPTVIVPSGRQAQIKTVEVRTIVTDLDRPEKPGQELMPISEPFELGPSLDVVPVVMADGHTVQMTLMPSLKEFVGYDFNTSEKIGAATGVKGSIPLPIFRIRQVVTRALVRDGQTVVLGLGTAEVPSAIGGPALQVRNPGLRLNLLVFITPTMVDPAGNRVHKE